MTINNIPLLRYSNPSEYPENELPAASCRVSVFRSQNTEAGMGQRHRPLLLNSTEF